MTVREKTKKGEHTMSKQIEKDLSRIAKALESLLRLKEEEVRGNAKRRIETAVTIDGTNELLTFTCNHCKHLWVKHLKTFCEDKKNNPHDILIKSTVLDGRSCPYCGYINQVYFYDDCELDNIQYTCVNCKRRWTGPRE